MTAAPKPDSDRPLYLQIVEVLRAEIARKRAGERIESEPALAERFGVSRFTVTRAIELLVDEGLIRRRQGLGSFVAPPPLRRQPSYLASFAQAVAAQGRTATHRLLAFGPTPWREGLPYAPAQRLVRLDRLRFVDDVPTALHASVLAAEFAERIGLTAEAAASPKFSLYGRFAEVGAAVARGVETLRARAASAEERRLLELGDDAVVMEVTRLSYDASGGLLDFVDAVYDARRYAYQTEIRSAAAAAPGSEARGDGNARIASMGHDFGPRLGPWDDDGGRAGQAGGADRRARRSRRSIV